MGIFTASKKPDAINNKSSTQGRTPTSPDGIIDTSLAIVPARPGGKAGEAQPLNDKKSADIPLDPVAVAQREAAEALVKRAEIALAKAEAENQRILGRKVEAEKRSTEALDSLRAAEEAYSAGCESLAEMEGEFGEARVEVEMALERTEATLLSANLRSNAALRQLKDADQASTAAMLVLIQAEQDHHNA
eukprot:CAMPEP_0206236598 /NCGR_PEP_ID=MMETSP0047_2-20121206/13804_1 /ASSEMBLY_ACC=CAM_ASM_000192 /TAXON_ID=195065 /ORGANISM="Chroomonas mesostigmatica_cf, Strain CCMP1168" /LENGTH=189 /DNA_ID=CAMNT_0053660951 /DNA_START=89 /DNA_END=655 /DNA_ORIENTATION=+